MTLARLREEWESSNWQRKFTVDEIDDLLDIAEAAEVLVGKIYPDPPFDGSSGDPGAVAVVKVRTALETLAKDLDR